MELRELLVVLPHSGIVIPHEIELDTLSDQFPRLAQNVDWYTNWLFEDPASFRRTWLREYEFLARWHDLDSDRNRRYEQFGIALLGREPAQQTAEHMD